MEVIKFLYHIFGQIENSFHFFFFFFFSVLFYGANVVSGALYAAGFAETLIANFGPKGKILADAIPDGFWYSFAYAAGVLVFCLIISLIGAKAFSKATIIFMILLIVAIGTVGVSFSNDIHVSLQYANSNLSMTLFGNNQNFFTESS